MAQTKIRERLATFAQVLEYIDGPQAVLLDRTPDYKIVAVAIQRNDYKQPFFGAGISLGQWEKYRRGFVDLRFLFVHPQHKEWYLFDLQAAKNKLVSLTPVEKDQFAEENYIPEHGFFSYDHSEPIKATETDGLATQKYNTDGIWDLPDFTQFYHKVTDLYAFSLSLKKYVSPTVSVDLKRKIKESFSGHPLRGGSSYGNLYSGLLSVQSLGDRLSVGRLRYASPGEIDVKGRLDVFAEVAAALAQFSDNYDAIKDRYNTLYNFLQKNKLLKMDVEKFEDKGSISDYILKESNEFSKALMIEDAKLIYELTDKNSLKFAKVLLAHFRRLDGYFMFFAE